MTIPPEIASPQRQQGNRDCVMVPLWTAIRKLPRRKSSRILSTLSSTMVVARAADKEEKGVAGNTPDVTKRETTMAASEQKAKPKGIEFYGGYEVYSESGVDLTLLRENLRKTLEERWQDACRGAILFEAFHQPRSSHSPGKERTNMFDAPATVRCLTEQHVEFVIVGGLAMIARGSTYFTKDLDICYQRTPDNLAALAAALAPLHPYLRGAPEGLPFRLDVPTLQAGLNFTLITDCGALDLLGEVSGVGNYSQVLAQSSEELMFDMKVRVLSIDGLIAAKKAAGRNKDHGHLQELLELKKMLDAAHPTEPTP